MQRATLCSVLQFSCFAVPRLPQDLPHALNSSLLTGVEPVALKVVGGSANEASDDGVQRAMRELAMLRDCRSPQIVQFLGACIWHGQVSLLNADFHCELCG